MSAAMAFNDGFSLAIGNVYTNFILDIDLNQKIKMKKSGVLAKEQIKKEDVKQAVIVDYKAIGCRSPGGNSSTKPFIQYTLEWLLIEQFDEIFVCCLPDNAQQMREFVRYFLRTENVPLTMTVQVHSSENNRSTGDCLRDLDAKALIKTDFVIMDVGCCGNLPLADLLDAHKQLKKKDKNVILTSIVRNLFTKNPAEIGEFPIYVTDPLSGLLLHYVMGRVSENEICNAKIHSKKRSVDVPSKILTDREHVKVHTNLCSTNLSIYSANVPILYAELFDCHSEADLIQAAFDNHEVLGGTIYIHIVDDLFSQRMADFGFVINQKCDKFDTNLIYKRNHRCQVLRKLVNDSLIDCTQLNLDDFILNLDDEEDSNSPSESETEDSIMDDEEAFLCEVLDSLVRGYEEAIKNENLILEVNSSKHAYNISINDVYSTIGKALLLLPTKLSNQPKNVADYSNLVEKSIIKFKQFLLNYMKTEESKEVILTTFEDLYISKQIELFTDTVLAKVIYKLYEIDGLDEEQVLNWFRNYEKDDELQHELRSKPALKQLIQALEADSSDDED